MNKSELDTYLRTLRPIEIEYRDHPQYEFFRPGRFTMPKDRFIAPQRNFDIYLHDRYGMNVEHCHDFIEMQYVYDGEFDQSINGEDFKMHTGDLCILNTVTPHFIKETTEKDIIVNFLFAPEFFDFHFFGNLGANDLFSDFFMRSVYQGDHIKRHLLFRLRGNERVRQLITDIMCERFDPGLCSTEIIQSSLILLFAELLRVHCRDKQAVLYHRGGTDRLSDVIEYMEKNYAKATLRSVAAYFGYSPGHLGTLLKDSLQKNYTEMQYEIRMMNAAKMLLGTSIPVSDIAGHVGYSNISHFYKLFRRKFGVTPQEYRLSQHNADQTQKPSPDETGLPQ